MQSTSRPLPPVMPSTSPLPTVRVGLARGEGGGVPPQAPCLIKFIRIDIDLYIR